MNRLLRVLAVLGFLLAVTAARPAAQSACSEYMCKIVVAGGGGYYCINEGEFDCQCNDFSCFCGYCYCFDNGDCVLMPYQG